MPRKNHPVYSDDLEFGYASKYRFASREFKIGKSCFYNFGKRKITYIS